MKLFRFNLNHKLFITPKNRGLFLGFLFTSLLALAVFFVDAYQSYLSEVRLAQIQVNNLAHVLDKHVESSFKKIDLVLLDLQDTFLASKDFENLNINYNNLLVSHKDRLPEVLSLKVVNEEGEFVADDLGYLSEQTLLDREYFQKMKKDSINQLVISKPVISKTTGRWVVVLSRPIMSHDDKFLGLILATIPVDYYHDLFKSLNVGNGGSIALINLDRYLFARHPELPQFNGKKLELNSAYSSFIDSQRKTSEFSTTSQLDSVKRIFAARKLNDYPFSILVGVSASEFLYNWKIRNSIHFIFIISTLLILTFFLANFFSSQEMLEEQRQQAIQSAKLSSMGEMACGIAHEINNPLMIISSYAKNIKKINSDSQENQKISEASDKIISTVSRIAKIVKGLRAFGRDTANDPFELVSLAKIISTTIDLCHDKIIENDIDLKVNQFADLSIQCKEVQIEQVLINLINNSIDAISSNVDKWIQIEVSNDDRYAYISISDCGNRISDEIADKIMQPFYTTKEVGRGLGLGLSISKGIIESHAGEFYLDRKKSNNTFVIKIPKETVS